MRSIFSMGFGKKLLLIGGFLVSLPSLLSLFITWRYESSAAQQVFDTFYAFESDRLDHIASLSSKICTITYNEALKRTERMLQRADHFLLQVGAVTLSPSDFVQWECMNQFTKTSTSINLPRFSIGSIVIEKNSDMQRKTPLLDDLQAASGGYCTLFQRMNPQGDMLRIATNVPTSSGKRAIGTYIPATNPDGAPNPVISAVLQGKTYFGRAFVVDQWCSTAYAPLKDSQGNLIGLLFAGFPERDIQKSTLEVLKEIQIGKSGYIFIIEAKGERKGRYILSKGSLRDGENIWDSKDADGHLFIQDLCQQALAHPPNSIRSFRYSWKNSDEDKARLKIARFTYFEPWGWVIAASAYEDELNATGNRIRLLLSSGRKNLLHMGLLSIGVAMISFAAFSHYTTRKINHTVLSVNEISSQVAIASSQVAGASQSLAEGASQQTTELDQTNHSLEQLVQMTQSNAESARISLEQTQQAKNSSEQSSNNMRRLAQAMNEISQILKNIDEIAFQTNILALNAAVEAARAGEAGAGFAVVADEVRNLAQRSASAAHETASKIQAGLRESRQVGESLDDLVEKVQSIDRLIQKIAEASLEQSRGIALVKTSVDDVGRITQSNSSMAEQTASAASELNAQAASMREAADILHYLMAGRSTQPIPATEASPPTRLESKFHPALSAPSDPR